MMGARFYSPSTGRFLPRDPVRGGNENAYNYPNDPVNTFHSTGTKAKKKAKAPKENPKDWTADQEKAVKGYGKGKGWTDTEVTDAIHAANDELQWRGRGKTKNPNLTSMSKPVRSETRKQEITREGWMIADRDRPGKARGRL